MQLTDKTFHVSVNESDLWSRFKKGDRDALSRIYHAYYNDLYTYGLKLCGDAEITEDCIQDIFLVLWNARQQVSEVHSVKAYLFKSFRGRLFKQLKKSRKLSLLIRHLGVEPNPIIFSTEELLIHQQFSAQQQQRLVTALNQLSDRQREVLYLRFYKDLSYEEIGEIIPLHYQSIRNCVHEAIKNLRKHMLLNFLMAFQLFS